MDREYLRRGSAQADRHGSGRRLAVALLKGVSVTVAACLIVGGDLSYSETGKQRTTTIHDSERTGPQTSNTAIRWLIQAQYRADASVHGGRISVQADNGVVTLSGAVDSEHARARAVALAERVRGVTAVHDRLQVVRHRHAAE